jgi:dimethylaniline monooxygenase (N-oxide forming)
MGTHQVCIIGAGSSGIAAAKIMHEQGIPFDCFEKGSGIGGNWRYRNDNNMSSAYKSLHINTSRDKMAYSDFPMPKNYPDFPHHSQILAYFEAYVDHFKFRDKITFQTEVIDVSPNEDGTYDITLKSSNGIRRSHYGAVIVANGHHWYPICPEFPGEFWGKSMHSHHYKTPEGIEDMNVLVMGMGNSGCDIACEVSRFAQQTFLSTRRGAHIIPKYIFGLPMDIYLPYLDQLPIWLQRHIYNLALFLARGPLSSYDIPIPKHQILEEHPTISSDLLTRVGHGKIKMKPNLKELVGDRIRFEDGTEEQVDILIYATGYKIVFPFFNATFIDFQDNEILLYKRVIHPNHPNLYFLGLVQPWGAIMPLAELQSQWVAALLTGQVGLPNKTMMEHSIQKEQNIVKKRYITSKRHTIQVDFQPYAKELKKEIQVGRKYPQRVELQPAERLELAC